MRSDLSLWSDIGVREDRMWSEGYLQGRIYSLLSTYSAKALDIYLVKVHLQGRLSLYFCLLDYPDHISSKW